MGSSSDESERLTDYKTYDVTNYFQSLQFCCTLKSILTLESEEAVLETSTCISSASKRMPYGELGSVEHQMECGCCHSLTSNLSPIAPGFGCSGDLVQQIVDELKGHMKGRGDTGNIQRAEDALWLMTNVNSKCDALLAAMQVQPVREAATDFEEFKHLDYDVTPICLRVCCCGHSHLDLEHEEAILKTTTICGATVERRPYGELGSVQESKCCCCVGVESQLGAFQPGCGCEKELVAEVVEELKRRMKARGDTGNIQRQEDIIRLMNGQEAKLDALLQKMGVSLPQAPSQKVMG